MAIAGAVTAGEAVAATGVPGDATEAAPVGRAAAVPEVVAAVAMVGGASTVQTLLINDVESPAHALWKYG